MSAVVPVVVTASPEEGCGEGVGDDESVDVEPASGVAVAVERVAVEWIASFVPVVVESTCADVDVPAVAVDVATAVPTDPRSARAVGTMGAALSNQHASIATTVSRK